MTREDIMEIETAPDKTSSIEWPEPRRIKADLPPPPSFEAEKMLPRFLAEFVLDEADRMCAAPDYVAATLIVALGSVIGSRCAIKPKRRDDWIVTTNLFGGVVGEPSSKKTPATGKVLRFLDMLEAKEQDLLEQRQKTYVAELAAYEANEAAIRANMKKAAIGKVGEDEMEKAIADHMRLKKPEEPRPRRFKTNDTTVEKLGDILAHNPSGLLVFRDELMGLLSSWERDGHDGDRAFYLEAWNGTSSFSIDRIGRGSLHVPTLCLSVFGGIQPELMERYLSSITEGLDNDGRIQRFQVLVFPEQPKWEWRDRHPVVGAREAVGNLFSRLAYIDPVQEGAAPANEFIKLPHFCFDDDAQEVFIAWSTELNCARIPSESNPLMRQHLAKYEKLFCALALILNLAEGQKGQVSESNALRAAQWCSYLEGHARRIYTLIETARVGTAAMLARRIGEGKLANGFSARDVFRKGWRGIKSSLEAEGALSILEENGWIVGVEQFDPKGGRPTTRYYINPKARRP